ncbi:MAG: type I-U CRISPR-associated protein Csx17 [Betaproteobacteria bacterium]|nr:type I-U CRISPR-associated protein Csx17 [Betaproteobacteria bacterium]
MNEPIPLAGCTPTPLAHYLKALGVFRLLAEQKDPEAKACWQGEQFVLHTRLTREELARFFLEEYRPTPILSPWNGRAGYLEGEEGEDSTRRGPELLRQFRQSTTPRLEQYRSLIAVLDGFGLLKEMNQVRARKKDLDKAKKAHPKAWTEERQAELAEATRRDDALKQQQLQILRNELPDDQLSWLDAVVAIGADRAFAPLLGSSGGVEGSMDLGVNFMDNLLLLFPQEAEPGERSGDSLVWLAQSLFGTTTRLTAANGSCSLAPGRVGGHNATSGFTRYLNINPWDFVLMIEGAVAFKPSLTRKLESVGQARLSYPFTVEPASIGAGAISASDDNNTRAGSSEVWMPLWSRWVTNSEVASLLREGSVRLGAKAPKDGLDMARSIAKLGMDRGIAGFQRYLFLKRSGKNDLAIPLSRFEVSRSTAPHVDLITDLEQGQFLDRLRTEARDKDAPASLKRTVAQLENALFALTQPGVGKSLIQRALILLGEVMQTLATSRKGREKVFMLPRLSAAWVMEANDDSAEFRLALALAGLVRMRPYLAPIEREKGYWQWAADSRLHVWGKGDLVRNLVRVVERRVIESQRNPELQPFQSKARLGARLSDIHAFIHRRTDDGLIASFLLGLIWADLPDDLPPSPAGGGAGGEGATVPLAYTVCKPFFAPADLLKYLGRLPQDARFNLSGELPRLLAANRADKAAEIAWKRGRIAGLGWPPGEPPRSQVMDGPRLLAALAVPIQSAALVQLLPRAEDLQPESV